MTSSVTRQDSDVNHKVGFGEDPYRDKNDDVICYDRYDMMDMNALLSTCHHRHAYTWCIRKSIKRIQNQTTNTIVVIQLNHVMITPLPL